MYLLIYTSCDWLSESCLSQQWIASDYGNGEKREPHLLLLGIKADRKFFKILNTELPCVCSIPIHTVHINPVDSAGAFLPPQNQPWSESEMLSWTQHLLFSVEAAETVPVTLLGLSSFSPSELKAMPLHHPPSSQHLAIPWL